MELGRLRASSALHVLARAVLLTGDGAAMRMRSARCLQQWQQSFSDGRNPSKAMKQKQALVPRVLRAKPRPKSMLPKTEWSLLSNVRFGQANLRLPCFD